MWHGTRVFGTLCTKGVWHGTLRTRGCGTLRTRGYGTLRIKGCGTLCTRGCGMLVQRGCGTLHTKGVAHYVQRGCGTLHTKRVWHSTAETAWYKWWAQHLGVSVTCTKECTCVLPVVCISPYASVLLLLSNHKTLHDCAIVLMQKDRSWCTRLLVSNWVSSVVCMWCPCK